MANLRLCSIPNCGKVAHCRGWCTKHYQRWKAHSDPLWQKAPAPMTCSIPDCGKPTVNSRGWCQGHYQRWRNYGDPLQSRKRQRGICSIPDCGKPHYGNNFCAAHNKRFKTYGDPLYLKTAPPGEPARYFKEVVLTYDGDDCFAWPYGTTDRGYGVLTLNGEKVYAHRLVCEAVHGPAPTLKHEAAHSCGRGDFGCVAPRHLSWKTPKENNADQLTHGTRARGAAHYAAKLTEDDVREIRALVGKASWREIARRFGVSSRTIRVIHARKNWTWLD
ncbi:MAG: hypothetical protein EOR13_17715 [Mesorhizobium sp.]|nr:MAG: hypothetical protein EOR13_17715 [Mesorhizobium sp.]